MKKKSEQRSSVTADDMFRQALQGVTPIVSPARVSPAPPTRKEFAARAHPAHTEVAGFFSDQGANEVPPGTFLRPGLNNMTLRKMRRGQWPVEDTIDLHGHTLEQARAGLFMFLQHALQQHMRCVSVIHGKGWQAGGSEGVLKIHARHWLAQFPQVLAFCEPPAHAGGGGAVWVLLKAQARG